MSSKQKQFCCFFTHLYISHWKYNLTLYGGELPFNQLFFYHVNLQLLTYEMKITCTVKSIHEMRAQSGEKSKVNIIKKTIVLVQRNENGNFR